MRALLTPPFMHGAGHWVRSAVLLGGGTVHLPSTRAARPGRRLAHRRARALEFMLIVGDAFARPLLDELDRARYDLSSLNVVLSGGAALSVGLKRELLAAPADGHDRRRARLVGGRRPAQPRVDRRRRGDGRLPGPPRQPRPRRPTSTGCSSRATTSSGGWPRAAGWPSATSATPAKTARTYPIVDGVRYAVPGDRARLRADGSIELHGRDAVTINSGGEKIFAEEVEAAVKAHPGVADCVVAGRPSDRWGHEVVAIVQLRRRRRASTRRRCSPRSAGHIARYKLPKARRRSSTRSSARRRASPTTAGPARSPASPLARRIPVRAGRVAVPSAAWAAARASVRRRCWPCRVLGSCCGDDGPARRRRRRPGNPVATFQVVDETFKIELATPELVDHARAAARRRGDRGDPARHGRPRRSGRQRAVVVAHRSGDARVRRHDDRGLRRAAVVRRGRHGDQRPVLPVVGQGHRRRRLRPIP